MEINTTKYEALWDRHFAKHDGKVSKVVGLTIESIGPSAKLGDICHKTLVVEIIGKHSKIIFCSEEGMIIDSIKHISSQVSSVREVLPGRTYFIPETQEKLNPLDYESRDFIAAISSKPMPL